MAATFGLPPDGEVTGLLLAEDGVDLTFAKKDNAYDSFLTKFQGTIGPVTETEYTAFLLYWLCWFIFCPPVIGVVSAHLRLAQAIAKGRNLSLLYWSIRDSVGLTFAKRDTAYGSFLTKFCGTTDLVTETVHTAFLLY